MFSEWSFVYGPHHHQYRSFEANSPLFLWLTLYDDYYELWPVKKLELERDRIIDIILGETPKPDDTGLYRQAATFRDEFLTFMPYKWIERLARSMYRYTTYGMMEEHPYRIAKRFPKSINLSYMREYTIGMYPYGDMIERLLIFYCLIILQNTL